MTTPHPYTLILCYTLLTACISQPVQTPEAVPELPSAFSLSGANELRSQWWESLADEQLNQLVDNALRHNPDLKATWQRLLQARALATQAGADLKPAVDGELQLSNTESNVRALDTHSVSLGLAASYEVDLWGRVEATADAARLEAMASEETYRASTISLTAEVATTWYRYLEQQSQISLLEQQLANIEQTLELIEFRFRQGKVGATDVLQQRQLVETRRGELISARSAATVLYHQLAVLQGQPPDSPAFAGTTALPQLPALPATGLPADLIKSRPDIRAAHYTLQAVDRDVAAAVANRYPRLSLSASLRTSSSTLADLLQDWLATVTANLVAPLFDAGQRQAAVDQQRARLEELLNTYRQTLLVALQEVEDALQQEHYQTSLIENLDKRLALSEQIIQRTRDNYNNGVEDYLRVLDAQLTHQELQRSRLTAQRQLIEFRIGLYRALASGWRTAEEERNLSLN